MTQARRPPPIRGSIGPEDHWFTTQRKQVALTNSIGTDWPVRLLARSARQLRVEIQIKSGHLSWAKKDQSIRDIDIKQHFDDYWTSKEHELTVPGRSSSPPIRSYLIERCRGICCWKVSLLYRIKILCEPYGSPLRNRPSHPAKMSA